VSQESQAREGGGQFGAHHGDRELFDILAAVALVADPHAPESVSRRAWNDARDDPALPWERIPTGQAIQMRLNSRSLREVELFWGELLRLALDPAVDHDRALMYIDRAPEAEHLGERHLYYALNVVAKHLRRRTLAPDEYVRGVGQLLASRPRGRRARLAELLPSQSQILRIAGMDWDRALQIAELEPRPRPRPRAVQDAPTPASREPGMPAPELIVHFVLANGRLPGSEMLAKFAREWSCRLRAPKKERQPYRDHLVAAQELLRAGGHDVPATMPRPTGRYGSLVYALPDYPPPEEYRRPAEGSKWNEKKIVVALTAWDRGLRASERRTLARYREDKASRPEWPPHSVLPKYGGFTALMAKVRSRRRAR
jgi:hypothetical protein